MTMLTRRTLVKSGTAATAAVALTAPALLDWAKAWAQAAPWKPEKNAQLAMLRWKYFVQAEDDAFVALLDAIKTPVIILSHSQGGAVGWLMADARPNQVKGIVTAEPGGPPIRNVDTAKIAYATGGGGMSWGVTASPITYDPPIKAASELQIAAKLGGDDIIAVFRERHNFKPGDKIRLKPDPRLVHLFDEPSGQRLNA